MVFKGITKRWISNSLSVIIVILTVLIISFAFVIKGYFYSGIKQTINGRANELTNVFRGYSSYNSEMFTEKAKEYVEGFSDEDFTGLMAFNSNDELIATLNNNATYQEEHSDYNMAKTSTSNYSSWTGRLSSGESVMSSTRAMYNANGEYLGAVRYVVSLHDVNKTISFYMMVVLAIAAIILIFAIMSGIYFIRSIVMPVGEITTTAKRIAQGDFNAKIDKQYDDEIGVLCDTINYMAGELAASEKIKNDFISSVSHELRTPLTAIKGWAETMQSPEVDREMIEKGMNIIVHESERLYGIVEELLDFSRMQSGRMVLMMDKMDILAELDEAVYMFKDRANSEGKYLLYDEPKIAPPVLGDKNRLRQVFINIIDNALKYTPKSGTIIVKVVQDNTFVHITVEDNGMGIPSEHLPKVKDKFYKADHTQRGSGIGLAVADEIISLHLGKLDIFSEEGVGTKVTISLPLIQSSKEDENS